MSAEASASYEAAEQTQEASQVCEQDAPARLTEAGAQSGWHRLLEASGVSHRMVCDPLAISSGPGEGASVLLLLSKLCLAILFDATLDSSAARHGACVRSQVWAMS